MFLSMMFLSVSAIISISICIWISGNIQGDGHEINRLGHMRMESYRLLSKVPLKQEDLKYIDQLEADTTSPILDSYWNNSSIEESQKEIITYWFNVVKPSLLKAESIEEESQLIAQFEKRIDNLVNTYDQDTEYKVLILRTSLYSFLTILLLLFAFLTTQLRLKVLLPWRDLMRTISALKSGTLSARCKAKEYKGELSILGTVINDMAEEVQLTQAGLEEKIKQKTKNLTYKNRLLDFMFQASGTLISQSHLEDKTLYTPILNELKEITNSKSITLDIYSNEADIPTVTIKHIVEDGIPPEDHFECLLLDEHKQYGSLHLEFYQSNQNTTIAKNLIQALADQITRSIASKQQAKVHESLVLAEERAAIARELHDSIAQSLSSLKMRISALQMQKQNLTEAQVSIIKDIRTEISSAYSHLRQLLSTFRLQLSDNDFQTTMKNIITDFNHRLGFDIDYTLGAISGQLTSVQEVNLVFIIKEALNNIFKHAKASDVAVSILPDTSKQSVIVTIKDNGVGIIETNKPDHHGLNIMKERAFTIDSDFVIHSSADEGTEIQLTIHPKQNNLMQKWSKENQ